MRPKSAELGDDHGVGAAKAAPSSNRGAGCSMACVPLPRPAPEQVPAGDKPKRSMFDGLKLSAGRHRRRRRRRPSVGRIASYVRAVERTARSARGDHPGAERGAPVLEHQKVALERARGARPNPAGSLARHDRGDPRDPGLLGEAAAGRSGPMMAIIPRRGAGRSRVARRSVRGALAGALPGARPALSCRRHGGPREGGALGGHGESLERDPQVESILRGRTRELGLEIGMNRSHDFGRGDLGRELALELGMGRGRDLGMSR
jgi:hypothetical protein